MPDSNQRPTDYKSVALPTELNRLLNFYIVPVFLRASANVNDSNSKFKKKCHGIFTFFKIFFRLHLLCLPIHYLCQSFSESLNLIVVQKGYFCVMQSYKICFLLCAVFLIINGQQVAAQTGQIDTIVVNLSGETDSAKQQNTAEPTPTLNLAALRNQAKEDSMRNAKLAQEKEKAEKERLAALKAKKRAEKELKEKEKAEKTAAEKLAKETAAKKKAEKERLAAIAEKKKQEKENKEAAEKALAEKKKKELAEKLKAQTLAKEKETAEEAKKKKETAAKKAQVENKEIAKQKGKEPLAKQTAEKLKEQTLAKEKETQEKLVKKKASENTKRTSAPSAPQENKPDLPKPPKGVVQKDNPYGTVRLAFDKNAASFLLSIPTETKMHYHANHSEHVMLIEGQGMLLMGYKTIDLKKNELIFITEGTPHKIINTGKSKLKVLSIQSPFYDGTDIVILE